MGLFFVSGFLILGLDSEAVFEFQKPNQPTEGGGGRLAGGLGYKPSEVAFSKALDIFSIRAIVSPIERAVSLDDTMPPSAR